ncbi:MAG: hypothetical protein ACRDYV_13835, partial [Acidimicrobiia bacterium]
MNDAVVFVARRSSRRDRAGWAAVALLAALTATVGLGALSAARRTLDAHPRLLERLDAPDATVFLGDPGNPEESLDPGAIAALPEVRQVAAGRSTLSFEVDAAGNLNPAGLHDFLVVALDDRLFATVGRPFFQRGRMPRPDEADAVAVSTGGSRRLHVDVGDRLRFRVLSETEIARAIETGDLTAGTLVTPEVVGIYQPHELGGDPRDPLGASEVLGSAAFFNAHPGIGTYRFVAVSLHGGEGGLPDFERRLESTFGSGMDPGTTRDEVVAMRRAVRPEAMALGAFGLVAAFAGLLLVAQAVARQLAGRRDDQQVLTACGLTRRQRAGALWLP